MIIVLIVISHSYDMQLNWKIENWIVFTLNFPLPNRRGAAANTLKVMTKGLCKILEISNKLKGLLGHNLQTLFNLQVSDNYFGKRCSKPTCRSTMQDKTLIVLESHYNCRIVNSQCITKQLCSLGHQLHTRVIWTLFRPSL